MALNYKAKGGDFRGIPAGNYIAVCNMVADLGLQPGFGQWPDPKHQVYIRFEIPQERVKYQDKSGKECEGPRVIGATYTASMGKKANLRKVLEQWRGKAFTDDEAANFDVAGIIGKACMLNVVEKDSGEKTYSNIGSIAALPKGVPVPKAENPLLLYAGDEHRNNLSAFPDWVQEKILNPAKEVTSHATGIYAEEQSQEQPPVDSYTDQELITDDDIPF